MVLCDWLYACDCAEHVLPSYERYYPGRTDLRFAVEAARARALEREEAILWTWLSYSPSRGWQYLGEPFPGAF